MYRHAPYFSIAQTSGDLKPSVEKYNAPKKPRIARSVVSDVQLFDIKDFPKREFVRRNFELYDYCFSNSLEFSLVTFIFFKKKKVT
jgi:hypothetical protein